LKLRGKFIKISCDGGAATGKSTGAQMIAKKYNLKFLSSGLLYRYAAFLILKNKPKNRLSFLKKIFKKLNYKKLEKINLKNSKISKYSSIIAKDNNVRNILKKFQVNFSKKYKNCCIEGRDISTKILPDSDVKFYFECNLNIASKRRYQELKKLDPKVKLKDVKKALKIRNILDRRRKHSPLLKHRNSVVIDTGKLNKQTMLKKMSSSLEKILVKKYGN
tara:strand:- start:310 stop:966 length:657 start_codon:yes stop_codon:yes gene_type:complete